MMPSAQKQQNNSNSSTLSDTGGYNPAANGKFSQAELAQRSLARGIDKKVDEMNQEKSKIAQPAMYQTPNHEVVDIPDDRSFSTIHAIENIPGHVMEILRAHNVEFSDGDKIQHIPGASFFSIIKQTGEEKIHTFSLNEVIHNEAEEIATEEPENIPEIEPVPLETIATPSNLPGTLGTVVNPVLSGEPKLKPVVDEPESIPEPAPVPVISESASEDATKVSPEASIDRFKKSLDQARMMSGREREPYYTNRYRDKITGSFAELFGNNQSINQSLFKTIHDYESAKMKYLQELETQKKPLTEIIGWERGEYHEFAKLLSQKKYTLFTKLAQFFHITVPTALETRNRVITTTSIATSTPKLSERLGIHVLVPKESVWQKLLQGVPENKPLVSRIQRNPEALPAETLSPTVVSEQITTPEHHADYGKISRYLTALISKELGLHREEVTEQLIPVPISAPIMVGNINKKQPEDLFA